MADFSAYQYIFHLIGLIGTQMDSTECSCGEIYIKFVILKLF